MDHPQPELDTLGEFRLSRELSESELNAVRAAIQPEALRRFNKEWLYEGPVSTTTGKRLFRIARQARVSFVLRLLPALTASRTNPGPGVRVHFSDPADVAVAGQLRKLWVGFWVIGIGIFFLATASELYLGDGMITYTDQLGEKSQIPVTPILPLMGLVCMGICAAQAYAVSMYWSETCALVSERATRALPRELTTRPVSQHPLRAPLTPRT